MSRYLILRVSDGTYERFKTSGCEAEDVLVAGLREMEFRRYAERVFGEVDE